jgi:hypothetical protein
MSAITIDNIAPIPLNVQTTAVGLRLFYGTTQIDDLLDDVFPETTPLTIVAVNIDNNAGVPIDVQFDNQTPILVGIRGSTSQTMQMPDAGECNSMNVTVWSAGTAHHDPIIRLKRKLGNTTPTCTAAKPKHQFRK